MPVLIPLSNQGQELLSTIPPGSLTYYLTNALTQVIPAIINSIIGGSSESKSSAPSLIEGVNVINVDVNNPHSSNPLIDIKYTTDGVAKTVSVPLLGHSVPYEFQPSQDDMIIKDAISNITPPEIYNAFFTPERIKIVQDGLVKIVKHDMFPREGLLSIITQIMDTTSLKGSDEYNSIYKNIEDNFGAYRFESLLDDYSKEVNSAAKSTHIVKKLFDPSVESKGEPNLEEQFNTLLTTIGDLIPTKFRTDKNGGQRPKQSYNYAHFIPLKPKSKKSFHDSNSRKVKSRRRKQSRNKHTTRRK